MQKDSDKLEIYIKILKYLDEQNAREFYPKTKDILSYINASLSDEDKKAERTINRYLNDVQEVFDVSINKKSGSKSGYIIDKELSADLNEIYKAIQLFERASLFHKTLSRSSKALRYFSFDTLNFQGLDKIDTIVKAISNRNLIEITHKRFDTNLVSTREVEPHLIKEYLNRWYLIAFDLSKNDFRTFGLDRLVDVKILKKKFKKHRTEEVKERFEQTIGLVYTPPQKVILTFETRQGRYFRANPWHPNYKVLKDDKNGLTSIGGSGTSMPSGCAFSMSSVMPVPASARSIIASSVWGQR